MNTFYLDKTLTPTSQGLLFCLAQMSLYFDLLCDLMFIMASLFTNKLLVKEKWSALYPTRIQDFASAHWLMLTVRFCQVLSVEGVLAYRDPHVWAHTSTKVMATLHVQVSATAIEQRVVSQVSQSFVSSQIRHFEGVFLWWTTMQPVVRDV